MIYIFHPPDIGIWIVPTALPATVARSALFSGYVPPVTPSDGSATTVCVEPSNPVSILWWPYSFTTNSVDLLYNIGAVLMSDSEYSEAIGSYLVLLKVCTAFSDCFSHFFHRVATQTRQFRHQVVAQTLSLPSGRLTRPTLLLFNSKPILFIL